MNHSSFREQFTFAIDSKNREVVEQLASSMIGRGLGPLVMLELSIKCRDAGYAEIARRMFEALIEAHKDHQAPHFELAFMHRLHGEHRKAVGVLEKVMQMPNPEFRCKILYAHMLSAMEAHQECYSFLSGLVPASTGESNDIFALLEYNEYLRKFPLGRALYLLDSLISQQGWAKPPMVEERILAAVKTRSPFALVRLGDGEGGCMTLGTGDEFESRLLYHRNRDELISMWFGKSFDWAENGFLKTAFGLINHLLECDVIGMPYESWIRHEYSISSMRGVPSLVNVLRGLLGAMPNRGSHMLCSQQIHLDLHLHGSLERILKAAGAVSIVSCLPEVKDLVGERFQLTDVSFYKIPGEQGSSGLLGEAATIGSHFPEVFHQLNKELSQPHDGRLFLVAGGLLGKIYAATIRRHGGIAIDVGSLVDAWTGRATRPGYTQKLAI